MLTTKTIFLALFFIWGIPLSIFRSRFRKIVYRTNHWSINVLPYFIKETKALFGNLYPDDKNYIKVRNFYRFYLAIYTLLFLLYFYFR